MYFKKIVLFLLIAAVGATCAHAQNDDFCEAFNAILHDAPNQFKNVRGKMKQLGYNAAMWDPTIKIPGTLNARFVGSMGLFYEGAVLQTADKREVEAAYFKYRDILTQCLQPAGYKITTADNYFPDMENYKKLVFMRDVNADTPPNQLPPHVTMEATYSKQIGQYTIVFYIFVH